MSNLPINPLSPEEQQRIMGQMYLLMAKQVKSYHKMRHMGDNSSVPVELAQALLESIEYTTDQAGGVFAFPNVEEALRMGQELLESKVEKAKSMLDLVVATAPAWQTECRWEMLQCLRRYLAVYDWRHLAHTEPESLFYPIPTAAPDGVKGIDLGLFYLNVLWQENQIMAAFEDEALERLWNRLPTDALNQCEQVVLNGIGKAVLRGWDNGLVFTETERNRLQVALSVQPPGEIVQHAALSLCHRLELSEHAAAYLCATAAQLAPRLEAVAIQDHLGTIFL